jgi:hypothetical protein
MRLRNLSIVCFLAAAIVGLVPEAGRMAAAAGPVKPSIAPELSAVLTQMGKTLSAPSFSFEARTIRVYSDAEDQMLHIEHTFKITVRRPDRMRVDVTGDDGDRQVVYDGSRLFVVFADQKQYLSIPVPNTIQGMLQVAVGHFGMDFPLADFLINSPDQAFLTGVTSGREVDTVTIGGVACRHLIFSQPPGSKIELWVEKNEQAVPRRFAITDNTPQDQSSFIADLSNWNFSMQPTDADFSFQPPDGMVRLDLSSGLPAAGAKP